MTIKRLYQLNNVLHLSLWLALFISIKIYDENEKDGCFFGIKYISAFQNKDFCCKIIIVWKRLPSSRMKHEQVNAMTFIE